MDVGKYIGYPIVTLISIIGVRYLSYFHSFFFHWRRYRQLKPVTNEELKSLPRIPFIKIQITTRGSAGSTEVIRRGIQYVVELVREDPGFYKSIVSIEIVTESLEQKLRLEREFAWVPVQCTGICFA